MLTLAQDCCTCRWSSFSTQKRVIMDLPGSNCSFKFQRGTVVKGAELSVLIFERPVSQPALPDFFCVNPTQTFPTFRAYLVCQKPGTWKVCGTVGCPLPFVFKLTSCVLWILTAWKRSDIAVVSALTHVLAKSNACYGQNLPGEASGS